jgi:hypothetical protein
MIERRIRPLVVEALRDTRVVMVMGARQVGKSTLCEAIAAEENRAMVSLDDQGARETARTDPAGFLAGKPFPSATAYGQYQSAASGITHTHRHKTARGSGYSPASLIKENVFLGRIRARW